MSTALVSVCKLRSRIIFISFITFLNVCVSNAQNNPFRYTLGVKAGYLVDWVSFGEKEEKDIFSRGVKTGFLGGIIVGFPLKKEYSFIAEGTYSKKGRILKFNEDVWKNEATYEFIDMTMLLRKSFKFELMKNVPAAWYFNFGPEINYWLSGKGKISVGNNSRNYKVVFNKTGDGNFDNMYLNDVNRWLFGLTGGAGIVAPLRGNQKIGLELRFTYGHTFLRKSQGFDVNDYPMLGFNDTLKTNFKVISASLAYTFDFDRMEMRKGKSNLKKSIKKTR